MFTAGPPPTLSPGLVDSTGSLLVAEVAAEAPKVQATDWLDPGDVNDCVSVELMPPTPLSVRSISSLCTDAAAASCCGSPLSGHRHGNVSLLPKMTALGLEF